jgi:hypothetical protein
MVYIALIEIGGFKPGEEVPAEKALIWETMYDESPVKKISKKPDKEPKVDPKDEKASADSKEEASDESEEKAPVDSEKEEAQPEGESKKGSSIMLDDYLDRNTNVVAYNIRTDDLDGETLVNLLEHEKANKKREKVIDAIESKMKEAE